MSSELLFSMLHNSPKQGPPVSKVLNHELVEHELVENRKEWIGWEEIDRKYTTTAAVDLFVKQLMLKKHEWKGKEKKRGQMKMKNLYHIY